MHEVNDLKIIDTSDSECSDYQRSDSHNLSLDIQDTDSQSPRYGLESCSHSLKHSYTQSLIYDKTQDHVRLFLALKTKDVIFSKKRVDIDCDSESRQVPTYLRIHGKKYINPVMLDNGAFGVIIRYSIEQSFERKESHEFSRISHVCVKIRKEKKGLDTDIATLKKHKSDQYQVLKNVVVPGVVRSGRIIMPILLNDTDKFCKKFDPLATGTEGDTGDVFAEQEKISAQRDKERIHIIKMLARHLLALRNIGLFYTDIKLCNILYYYVNQDIKILLCDHGSLFSEAESAIFTYFPPERMRKAEGTKYDDPLETDLVWGIGNIMCELWGIAPIFEKEDWDDDCYDELQDTVMRLSDAYPEAVEVIKGIFVEQEHRISLDHVCKLLGVSLVEDYPKEKSD